MEIALQDLLETYSIFVEFYIIKNPDDFKDNFINFEKTLNFKEFDEFFDFITKTIEISKDFLIKRVNNFIEEMKKIFYSLLIY